MAKVFTVNGKQYTAKTFDFNLICDLEDMGIPMEALGNKPMSSVRAYFAICAGKGTEYAGKEMEQHLINGGDFEPIIKAMTEEMNNSDFFRHLTKNEEKTSTKSQKSKTAE